MSDISIVKFNNNYIMYNNNPILFSDNKYYYIDKIPISEEYNIYISVVNITGELNDIICNNKLNYINIDYLRYWYSLDDTFLPYSNNRLIYTKLDTDKKNYLFLVYI